MLDVGCGWGSFAIHAAERHGCRSSASRCRSRRPSSRGSAWRSAASSDRVEIRVQDYRELDDGPFDAVASIGMVEHVGSSQIDVYARQLARLVKPGGRVLNHGIARLRVRRARGAARSRSATCSPTRAPLHLSRIQPRSSAPGSRRDHVEGFRHDYAETLRHWARGFDDNLDEAIRLAGAERVRVWRLYLRAARRGFETGFTSIYQVRCSRPS